MSRGTPQQFLVADDGTYTAIPEPIDGMPRAWLITYHDRGVGFDVTPLPDDYGAQNIGSDLAVPSDEEILAMVTPCPLLSELRFAPDMQGEEGDE